VSLVHESLVGVLNRRFVNSYYNTFKGPGADPTAKAFLEKHALPSGASLRYGAIFTPKGEFVTSFGIDRDGYVKALKLALQKYPEYNTFSAEEQKVLSYAQAHPRDVQAQVRAAKLYGELLEFEKGRDIVDRALQVGGLSAQQTALLRYQEAHLLLLDCERTDRKKLERAYAAIESPPESVRDDIAMDLMSLDVGLRPKGAFFTGYAFADGVDLKKTISILREWIGRDSESNRLGQMYFYLGLAHMGLGDKTEADRIWKQHIKEMPEDRFAMLSRLHDTSYTFSPYGKNQVMGAKFGGATGQGGDWTEEQQALMKKIMDEGGKIRIVGDGYMVGDHKLTVEEAALVTEIVQSGKPQ